MERSKGVWLAAGVVLVGAGLAGIDHRLGAVLVLAALLAGWIWNPLQGPAWERFAGVLVLQMALLVPLGLFGRWLTWPLIWMALVLLLGGVVVFGVAVGLGSGSAAQVNQLDSWWVTRVGQLGVVALPTLAVGLPYLTRDIAGHLWLFSRGFDNSAHFNVTSAIAKTGAWPWGERFADVSGQLIFAPALPQQIWAFTARVLSLGGLPPGDLLVTGFAFGQVAAYALLAFSVLLVFRQLLVFVASQRAQLVGLGLLIVLLTFSSTFSLITSGFGNYATGIAGVLFALTGGLMLWQEQRALSLSLVVGGAVVAGASYAPLTLIGLAIAVLAVLRLGNRNHWLLYAIVGAAALMGVLLFSSNFYPLEALAETGGIVAIPVFSIGLLLVGSLAFLIFAYRSNKKPKERINNLIWFSSVSLGVATFITGGAALYSIAQVGSVSYYAIKFEYLLLVLLLPFFVAGATWVFSKFQFTNWIFVPASLVVLLIAGNLFGYSLPVGQRAFLATGLPPNYISPGLGWLQLADDPHSYPGFPGNLIAKAGQLPAEGVVVVWNPPDLAETQERDAQVYANSMRYTGNTWVWSLADMLLGTEWGDEALEQLWNWRWSNWTKSVTIYVPDDAEAQRIRDRLPEFVTNVEGGIAGCVAERTCLTEIRVLG